MKKKVFTKKRLTGALALVMAAALILGGTFAWKDFTQTYANILNANGVTNYAIALVDDFDTNAKLTDKTKTLNNWTTTAPVKKEIYVTAKTDNATFKELHPDLGDQNSYGKVFVRVKLTQSLTIDGVAQTAKADTPFYENQFDSYVKWTKDTNKIYTVTEWQALDAADQRGDFWIYDAVSGYLYWANPIGLGDETSKLLKSVQLLNEPTGDLQYKINVDLQAISDDLNSTTGEGAYLGGYADWGIDSNPIKDMFGKVDKVMINGGANQVAIGNTQGSSVKLNTQVTGLTSVTPSQVVVYTLRDDNFIAGFMAGMGRNGTQATGITIDQNGVLSLTQDVGVGTTYIVKATSAFDQSKSSEIKVVVTNPDTAKTVIGSDGNEIVISKDDNGTWHDTDGNEVVPTVNGDVYIKDKDTGVWTDPQGEVVTVITGTDDKLYVDNGNETYTALDSGLTLKPGESGEIGGADSALVPVLDKPVPIPNTKFSIQYPSSIISGNQTYQLKLDFQNPQDKTDRKVVSYYSSNPEMLSISEAGLISVGNAVNNTKVDIAIVLDDGSYIQNNFALMSESSYNATTDNYLGSISRNDSSTSLGTELKLNASGKAVNLSGNIYDAFEIKYEITDNDNTGSTITEGGWFKAGKNTGTVTVQATATATKGGTHTTTFKVFIIKPEEDTLKETSFSGNYQELVPANNYDGGTGTKNDPYLIGSVRQLKKIDFDVTVLGAQIATYEKYFKLMTDLDFEGADVSNSLINDFYGSFDGNGKVIKNLDINVTNGGATGIFSKASYAIIENIGRKDGETIGNGYYVGGIAGSVSYTSINNCYNSASLTGQRVIAGIAGQISSSSLLNCYNTGDITAMDSSYTYAGGLLGFTTGSGISMKNCYNTGNISGTERYVGGLVGALASTATDLNIENSFNYGSIVNKANNDMVSSIIGYFASSTFDNLTVANVRSKPNVAFKNTSTLVSGRTIGFASGANKTNTERLMTKHASEMSEDVKYTNDYAKSSDFVTELGFAFKAADNRTPKLAWEK